MSLHVFTRNTSFRGVRVVDIPHNRTYISLSRCGHLVKKGTQTEIWKDMPPAHCAANEITQMDAARGKSTARLARRVVCQRAKGPRGLPARLEQAGADMVTSRQWSPAWPGGRRGGCRIGLESGPSRRSIYGSVHKLRDGGVLNCVRRTLLLLTRTRAAGFSRRPGG